MTKTLTTVVVVLFEIMYFVILLLKFVKEQIHFRFSWPLLKSHYEEKGD